jgi:plasmid stabilization system protein ParE
MKSTTTSAEFLNGMRHASSAIDRTAISIGENPFLGSADSGLTRELGREVRSRLCGNYRIFYFVSRPIPEIFAILHTSRDLRETLANRAQ